MTAKKRGRKGGGSVVEYQTNAGTRYYIKCTVPDENGVRRQRVKRGFESKGEAGKALTALLADAENRGSYTPPTAITVGAYLDTWLAGLDLSPSTVASYSKNIRLHVKPRIGSVQLARLTSTTLEALYKTLKTEGRADGTGGLSPRTVRYVHQILHRALDRAVKDTSLGLRVNPAAKAEPPSLKSARAPEMLTWTASEVDTFMTWARGNANLEYVTAWSVLLATGVRRGELLALRWSDVDLDTAEISVRRSVTTIREHGKSQRLAEGSTKNGKSRVVPIDEATVAELKAHKARRAGVAFNLVARDALVFGDEEGRHRLPESFSRTWRESVARAQAWQVAEAQGTAGLQLVHVEPIATIRLHDLRHTHATLLLKAGIHPKIVQERLGHETISITLDRYSHVIPSMSRQAAEAFGTLFRATSSS